MKIKNIITGLAVAIGMAAGMTGCATDEPLQAGTGDGNVTFTIGLDDETATRAQIGNGDLATTLVVAIYDKDGKYVTRVSNSGVSYPYTVNLALTKGEEYELVFVAYSNSSTPYKFEWESGKMSVNYANMPSSNNGKYSKDHDIFYNVRHNFVAGGNSNESITLSRPVSQVNFGTLDQDFRDFATLLGIVDSQGNPSEGSLYFNITTTAYSEFNLLESVCTGEPKEVTTRAMRNITYSGTLGDFPIPGYKFLTSAYFFVGDPAETRTVKLNATNSNGSTVYKTLTVLNVPVKNNYRTNIYGQLLTTTDKIHVKLDPMFSNTINVWTGNIDEPVQLDENTFTINSPAQLAGLAKNVNAGNDYAGKTVMLTCDLDLGSINWTPIGTFDKPFNGVFDGDGHTISNLKIELGSKTMNAGLFGVVKQRSSSLKGKLMNFTIDGASVNTLKAVPCDASTGIALGRIYTGESVEGVIVKNATIDAYRWAGAICGKGYGSINNCVAENVKINMHFEKVANGYDNADKAGGIVGQMDESSYTLIGNTVRNVEITGYRHLGGIAGHVQYGQPERYVQNNYVSGGVIMQDLTHNYNSINAGEHMGEMFGHIGANVEQSNNTFDNVKLVKPTTVTDVNSLVQALENGGIVTLEQNLDLSSSNAPLTVYGNVKLNLNGHTLKVGAPVDVAAGGEVTLESGTITNSDGFAMIGSVGSKITITGGTLETTTTNQYIGALNTSGSLEITGGTFKSPRREAVVLNWADQNMPAQTLKISGGEFITDGNYSLNIYGGSCKNQHYAEINGGVFVGNSGSRVDGNVKLVINDGIFIQDSSNSTDHAFCAGAESFGLPSEVIINGGYFFGTPGYAICRAGSAKVVVNNAFVNKTGSGFTLGGSATATQLSTPVVKTVNGKQYSFGYQIK